MDLDCALVFGYDPTNDDYKILKVDMSPLDEIFSLKRGSWRALTRLHKCVHPAWPFGAHYMDYPAFVHGAFHWLVFSGELYVVSFSISNEVYGDIPLLEEMCNSIPTRLINYGVSEMGGMLCLYYTCNNYHGEGPDGTFMLWIMKDYGVKESWTVLLTIRDSALHTAAPKYRFTDGEVLLNCIYWGRIGSVFRTSKGPFGLWPQCGAFQEGFAYTESLISPNLLS